MSKPSILISSCLLGDTCRYDGVGKKNSELLQLLNDNELIAFCPEVEGGLPIPRPPAEIAGERVVREDGEDVTAHFVKGSNLGLEIAQLNLVNLAILKSRSPACGCGEVYDGSFTKTLTPGDGIFTQTLKTAGIDCISDEEFLRKNT